MQKLGRNDPCHCGSGKKYKHCHLFLDSTTKSPPQIVGLPTDDELKAWSKHCEKLDAEGATEFPTFNQWRGQANAASTVSQSLSQFLKDRNFASSDDEKRALAAFMDSTNTRGIDDFFGLSPSTMRKLHFSTFDEMKSLVELRFSTFKDPQKRIPLLAFARQLLTVLGESPVKITDAGYLPPKIVRRIYDSFTADFQSDKYSMFVTKNINERQVTEFMKFREILGLMGLTKIRVGELSITKLGSDLLAQAPDEQFEQLLNLYLYKLDWHKIPSYLSLETPRIMQESWLFGMFMAHKMSPGPFYTADYQAAFTRAFPIIESMYGGIKDKRFYERIWALPTFFYLEAFESCFALFERSYDNKSLKPQFTVTDVFKDLFEWKA